MREMRALWRAERRARWFFLAHLQGGLGAAAGYVALMLLAYERIGSAWAATAVLLADLLPAMLLGPVLGGVIDRTSRLGCAIAADLVRGAAFAGLILAGDVATMVALAGVAGLGSAIFRPATSALLPSLVVPRRLPAANALYGVVREGGELLGPALAAGLLIAGGPELVLALNAVTCAASAGLLLRLRGHGRAPRRAETAGIARSTAAGVAAVLRRPPVPTLIGSSAAVVLVAGTMNVAELVWTQEELGAGGTGYALLTSAYGCGLLMGSLVAGQEADDAGLRRRYLYGLALMVIGLGASALAPALAPAMLTFALTGAGNSLFLISGRVLLQRILPAGVHGRAFGLLDSVGAWGVAGAVLAGGALAGSVGGRATFALAGGGLLLVLAAATYALHVQPATREERIVRRRIRWL